MQPFNYCGLIGCSEAMREAILGHFDLGYLSLRDRAITERLMQRIGKQALAFARARTGSSPRSSSSSRSG